MRADTTRSIWRRSRQETLLDIVFREENTEDAVLHSRRAFENHYDGLQDSIRYHGLNPSDYPVAVICVCSAVSRNRKISWS